MRTAIFEDIPVGADLPSYQIVLTRNDIRKYLSVISVDDAQGLPSNPSEPLVAPPTLAAAYIFRSYHKAWRPPAGRLHSFIEFDFLHPWREGSTITITGRVKDKYLKRGHKYVLFELSFFDKDVLLTRAAVEELTPK